MSIEDMQAAIDAGKSVFYNIDAADSEEERKAVVEAQVKYAKRYNLEDFYGNRICKFFHRDEKEELEIEFFTDLIDLMQAKNKLGVAYTYYHDGKEWYAHYTYGAHGPVPLTEFKALMDEFYNED